MSLFLFLIAVLYVVGVIYTYIKQFEQYAKDDWPEANVPDSLLWKNALIWPKYWYNHFFK